MTVSSSHDITDRTILFLEKFTDDELSELTVVDIEQGVYAFASRCDEDQIYEMIEILESSFYVLSESKTLTQLEESVVLCIVESLKSFIKSAGKKVARTAGYLTGLPIRIAKGLAYHYGRGYARGRGPNYGARGAQPQDSYDDESDYDYEPPDYSPPRAPRRTRQVQPVGYGLPRTTPGYIYRGPRQAQPAQGGYVLPRTTPGYAYQGPRQAPSGRTRRSRVGPFRMGVQDEYARQAQRAAAAAAAAAPRTVPASTRTPAQRAAAAAAIPRTVPASTRTPAQRAAAAAQTPAAATPRPSANPRAAGGTTPTSTRNRNRPTPAAAAPTPGTAAGAQTPTAGSPRPTGGTAAATPRSTRTAAVTGTTAQSPSGAPQRPAASRTEPSTPSRRQLFLPPARSGAPSVSRAPTAQPPSGAEDRFARFFSTRPSVATGTPQRPAASRTEPSTPSRRQLFLPPARTTAPSAGGTSAAQPSGSTRRVRTRTSPTGASRTTGETGPQNWRFVQSPRSAYATGRATSTSTSPLGTGPRTIRDRMSQPGSTRRVRSSAFPAGASRTTGDTETKSWRFVQSPDAPYTAGRATSTGTSPLGAGVRATRSRLSQPSATVTEPAKKSLSRITTSQQPSGRFSGVPPFEYPGANLRAMQSRRDINRRTKGRKINSTTYTIPVNEEMFYHILNYMIDEGYTDNYESAMTILDNLDESALEELFNTVFSD